MEFLLVFHVFSISKWIGVACCLNLSLCLFLNNIQHSFVLFLIKQRNKNKAQKPKHSICPVVLLKNLGRICGRIRFYCSLNWTITTIFPDFSLFAFIFNLEICSAISISKSKNKIIDEVIKIQIGALDKFIIN